MANDLALSVVLGATMSNGFNGMFGKASKSVGKLGQAMKATHIQLNQVQAYQRNESALDATRAKLGATQTKVMALRQEMAKTGGSAKLSKALETTHGKAVKLSATLEAQRGKLRQEGDALRRAGIDTKDLSSANERLTRTFEKQKGAMAANYRVMEKRKALRGQLLGQTPKLLAAAVFGRKAIASAVDFESAMADVKKVVNFDTPQQFAQMSQDITDLSLKLPMARDGIAAIVAAGAQAGLPRAELMRFAEDAAKMGVAFDTTADDAGTKLAQWRKAFGLTEDQVVALGDQINLLGNTAGASSLQISQVISKVGPLGKVGGLAGGQIAALGATMISMGIDADTAGTGTKNLMLAMTAGAAATPKQSLALKTLGIDAKQMAKRMQTDATGAIVELMTRLKQLPKEAQAATLTQLLGRESVAAVAPLLANLDALKQNFARVGDASQYAGSMQKEYLSRASTTGMTLTLGKNAWTALTGAIGNVFLPTLKVVVGKLIDLTTIVVHFSNKFPHLTAALVAGAAALVTFNTAAIGLKLLATFVPSASTLGGAIRLLVPGFGLAAKGIMLVGGALRIVGAALLANPIFIAIGLLAGAAYLIYRNWGPISDFFKNLWGGIKEVAGAVGGWISGKFSAAADAVKGAWSATTGFVGGLWNGLKGKVGEAGSWIASHIAVAAQNTAFAWHHPLQAIEQGWQGVKAGAAVVGDWFKSHMPKTAAFVSKVWSIELQGLGALWDWLKAKAKVVIDWISAKIEWVANKWKTLKGLPGAAWSDIKQAGAAIGSTLAGPTMATATAGGPAFKMPAMASRGNVTQNYQGGPTTLTVNAAPGMDERALAKHVREQLDERDRANAARRRSTLGDLE